MEVNIVEAQFSGSRDEETWPTLPVLDIEGKAIKISDSRSKQCDNLHPSGDCQSVCT